MTTPRTSNDGAFGTMKAWIVGLTGVLVVAPAMINAAYDVYREVAEIPTSELERINVQLFKHHFGRQPLFKGEVPITTSLGDVGMELKVYDGGDILVQYGEHSQWFRSPLAVSAQTTWLLRSAHAAERKNPGAGDYVQRDVVVDGQFLRERYHDSGVKETFKVDPRTGKWSRTAVGAYEPSASPKELEQPVYRFPRIGLTQPLDQRLPK